MYECSCGFTAGTATAMHKHLTTTQSPEHRHEQHRLVSGYKPRYSAKQQQQPSAETTGGAGAAGATLARLRLQAGGSSERLGSGSSTPNSMGFVSISPSAAHGQADPTAAAWEAVEQYYPSSSSSGEPHSSSQQQPGSPGPLTAHLAGSAGLQAGAAGYASGSFSRPDASPGARSSPKAATSAAAAAAASRLNVALTAAIHTRPSSTSSSKGAGQQHAAQQQQAGSAGWGSPGAADDAAAAAAVPLPLSTAANAGTQQQQQQQQQEFRFREQQQQQQHGAGQTADAAELAASLGSAFGVRISGSVMAAFGGWVVNEAVNAAAAAITGPGEQAAAVPGGSGSSARHAAHGTPAAPGAAAGVDGAGSGGRWSLSGLLSSSRKTTPRSGRGGEVAAAGVSGQQTLKASAAAAAAAAGAERSSGSRGFGFWRRSSSDDAGFVRHGGDSDDVTSDDESWDDDDAGSGPMLSDEEFDYAAAAAAAAAGAAAAGHSTGGFLARRRQAGAAAAAGQQEQALACGGGGRGVQQLVQRPGVARRVKLLRRLLMWSDVVASVKAVCLGLYCIMLVGNIPRGLHYMQLTTLLPGLALLWLCYNAGKPWAIRAYCCWSGKSSPTAISTRLARCEAALAEQVISWSGRAASELGAWCLALLALGQRALRGQRVATSVWTATSLWLLLLLSELRLMNQTLLAMLAFGSLFSVPWCYWRFRGVIDAAVCDCLHLVTLLALHAERWAYGAALLAAAVVWHLLAADDSGQGSLVVQGSAAALAALAVLVWRVVVAEAD